MSATELPVMLDLPASFKQAMRHLAGGVALVTTIHDGVRHGLTVTAVSSLTMEPPALLVSWLPAVGDPLCAVAGWLRLSFWPCVVYMAIGKFLRYLAMTGGLIWLFPQT